MKPEQFFPHAERERLEAAIQKAESTTSGEIVPYIVGQSDAYAEAPWRAGALVASLVLFVCSYVEYSSVAWINFSIMQAAVYTIAGFVVGAGLVLVFQPLKLLFVHHRAIDARVHERAKLAFLSEKVYHTRERTGILIFLSLLERRVVLLCDEGINAKVEQSAWDSIIETVITGIKAGRPSEGLLNAIAACGSLLASEHVAKRSGDTNELSDTIQIHES